MPATTPGAMPRTSPSTPDTTATRLLWLAAACALASTLFAGTIPIRTPYVLVGVGFLSYTFPGLFLTVFLAAAAYLVGRNPKTGIPVSVFSTLVSVTVLIVVALSLAYVCFEFSPALAASRGCTGTFGSRWLAGASVLCLVACPPLCVLALVAGIVAAVRR